jgi:hypothetical protein
LALRSRRFEVVGTVPVLLVRQRFSGCGRGRATVWRRARARNGLARYSLNNQLMIALQCPQATYVCGFRAWTELGYCVRKGERAIRILAPMKVRLAADDPSKVNGDGEDDERVFFRAVPVFDRSQVEPLPDREPAPLQPPTESITGDSPPAPAGQIPKLRRGSSFRSFCSRASARGRRW